MDEQKFDIFFALLRLKSFLISLIDNPDECDDSFDLTNEYLTRCYPDKKQHIIDLLLNHGIKNDCAIAFDKQIHLKFREIVDDESPHTDLLTMLKKLEIESDNFLNKEKELSSFKSERTEKLKEILESLLQLAKIWTARKEIEAGVDDYITLEEEELIRPEEEKRLSELEKDTSISFDVITRLTYQYLELFTDYYFNYGGDVYLNRFLEELEKLKTSVNQKYKKLFEESGLDKNPGKDLK